MRRCWVAMRSSSSCRRRTISSPTSIPRGLAEGSGNHNPAVLADAHPGFFGHGKLQDNCHYYSCMSLYSRQVKSSLPSPTHELCRDVHQLRDLGLPFFRAGVMYRVAVRIDRDGHRHVLDLEFVDYFHAQVVEAEDA